MATVIQHDIYSDCSISLALFRNVENSKELKKYVVEGTFNASLLKTNMIVDEFQVIAAVNKAVHLHKTNKMTTKTVHSEVLFCLSPTNKITECFTKFGIGDDDKDVLVVLIDDEDGGMFNRVKDTIRGDCVDISEIKALTDIPKVKKMYKITETESTSSSLLDSIVTRIAVKEIITV